MTTAARSLLGALVESRDDGSGRARWRKQRRRRGWQPPRGRAATSLLGFRRWVARASSSPPPTDLGETSVLRSRFSEVGRREQRRGRSDDELSLGTTLQRPAACAARTSRAPRILVRDTPVLAPRCSSQISNFDLEMTVLSAVQRITRSHAGAMREARSADRTRPSCATRSWTAPAELVWHPGGSALGRTSGGGAIPEEAEQRSLVDGIGRAAGARRTPWLRQPWTELILERPFRYRKYIAQAGSGSSSCSMR